MSHGTSPGRQPQFSTLIERAREVLGRSRQLNECTEGIVDRVVGAAGKPPRAETPGKIPAPLGPVTEQLGIYLDMISAEIDEAQTHINRLAADVPDLGPASERPVRAIGIDR